jgi:FdhE protein
VQRILEPSQIEALDQSAIPRVRLPERATLFATRAARLRQLAAHNPIGSYVRLMASRAPATERGEWPIDRALRSGSVRGYVAPRDTSSNEKAAVPCQGPAASRA